MFKVDIKKELGILPRSIWAFHCNSGSCNGCDIEIVALLTPRYDITFWDEVGRHPKACRCTLSDGSCDEVHDGSA